MSQENRITVLENGPLLCTGDIEVVAEDGYVYGKSDELALCRCGESKNRPFCDGSHKEAGFENDGVIMNVVSDELEETEGPLKMTVRSNAMVVAKGHKEQMLRDTISHYQSLNVWQVGPSMTWIKFVS